MCGIARSISHRFVTLAHVRACVCVGRSVETSIAGRPATSPIVRKGDAYDSPPPGQTADMLHLLLESMLQLHSALIDADPLGPPPLRPEIDLAPPASAASPYVFTHLTPTTHFSLLN